MGNTATTKYIWFNGEMVPWENANVHVMTHALHYGSSVFEGIRAYETPNGTCIFRLKEHIDRLFNSSKIYRFDIPFTKEEVMDACCKIMTENNLPSGYIRPLVFIGNVGLGVRVPDGAKAQVMVGAIPWGAYLGEEGLKKGVKVGVSSWRRLAPDTIPTEAKAAGNYLSSILIANECAQNGWYLQQERCVLPKSYDYLHWLFRLHLLKKYRELHKRFLSVQNPDLVNYLQQRYQELKENRKILHAADRFYSIKLNQDFQVLHHLSLRYLKCNCCGQHYR